MSKDIKMYCEQCKCLKPHRYVGNNERDVMTYRCRACSSKQPFTAKSIVNMLSNDLASEEVVT